MSKIDLGVFKVLDDEQPVAPTPRRKSMWLPWWIPLLVVAFAIGERTGVALTQRPEIYTGTLSLQCGIDGHSVLEVSGEQLDGDHVLEALTRVAGKICSKYGT